jgi:hypothetical protein
MVEIKLWNVQFINVSYHEFYCFIDLFFTFCLIVYRPRMFTFRTQSVTEERWEKQASFIISHVLEFIISFVRGSNFVAQSVTVSSNTSARIETSLKTMLCLSSSSSFQSPVSEAFKIIFTQLSWRFFLFAKQQSSLILHLQNHPHTISLVSSFPLRSFLSTKPLALSRSFFNLNFSL